MRTNGLCLLLCGFAAFAACSSPALAQFAYVEPPDVSNNAGLPTPVGTVDPAGPNTVDGMVTALWVPFSPASGDFNDSFSFVVPAGMEVRDLGLTVTSFTVNNAVLRMEYGPGGVGGFATIVGNGTYHPAIPGGALGAGTYAVSFYSTRLADNQPATAGMIYQVRITAVRLDDCAQARPVGVGLTPFDTTGATTDGPNHDECNALGVPSFSRDTWFTFTPAAGGLLTAGTCGSSFDTKLALYDGAACDNLAGSILACNDDSNSCGVGSLQSSLVHLVNGGQTYLIRVGGYSDASGPGTLDLALSTSGACCNRATGGCALLTASVCASLGCEFVGYGSVCLPGVTCTACPADFNRSGTVSVQDIFDFLAAYFAGCP